MKTSLFDFHLPESLIATTPASPRDSARMLTVGEHIHDQYIPDLLQHLRPGDVMVFNDTRVIPARLFGKRGEAKVELLLHKKPSLPEGEGWEGGDSRDVRARTTPLPNPPTREGREYWTAFAKPAKRLKPGDRIDIAEDFFATVIDKLSDGQVVLQFHYDAEIFYRRLQQHGHMPLPPYIARSDEASDKASYQTVYAKHDGSVAAPTAGLHFTENLLTAIDAIGVKCAHVTLHVGGGTFLPVKVDDTNDHIMHSEYAEISQETADIINAAKQNGGRVIAVGTTSLRTLESAADNNGVLHPFSGETNIFITPGYAFKIVDILLTNFHLPKSTLFMLVSAFAGLERMQAAYAHAIREQYRFYSYGDACLLFRNHDNQ